MIRKYHPRALAVGVIFEGDHEFGEIHPTPSLSRSTSEKVLHEINLNHLKESEREQVLAIVLKHQTLFTSDVKIAKVRTHRIRLKPNIEPYPIVCVNKKDGTLLLCVDFRALNSESVSDDFPMEDAVELIHSIEKPISSQQLNFTVNLKKCAFGKAQIKYLGHIIVSGKHEPDPEKTAVINNLPKPKTKELRSVLGLCNYYREYIPKYSELVYPLTELTKKEST
ncbi:retrovirus-related Pol polyprotein from transposon 17.6 [Trichonephila clavipes]|nr:retrovirus-related Pol polyprotein from transposon 17.6 [Trichonephila clavipes]